MKRYIEWIAIICRSAAKVANNLLGAFALDSDYDYRELL